jgi:hypothetical protein
MQGKFRGCTGIFVPQFSGAPKGAGGLQPCHARFSLFDGFPIVTAARAPTKGSLKTFALSDCIRRLRRRPKAMHATCTTLSGTRGILTATSRRTISGACDAAAACFNCDDLNSICCDHENHLWPQQAGISAPAIHTSLSLSYLCLSSPCPAR